MITYINDYYKNKDI